MKSMHEKAINSAVFPGLQGGPLMHVIAAKAVAFGEALKPEFKIYSQKILDNAQALSQALVARGLRIVSGRTESHLMLVDLRAKSITGKAAEAALGAAHITVNKNAIPNDPEKPMVTSGIRLGTPACTTRGFGTTEMTLVGNLIADVLEAPADDQVIAKVRTQVGNLTAKFPVYRESVQSPCVVPLVDQKTPRLPRPGSRKMVSRFAAAGDALPAAVDLRLLSELSCHYPMLSRKMAHGLSLTRNDCARVSCWPYVSGQYQPRLLMRRSGVLKSSSQPAASVKSQHSVLVNL
jgi:hypothetical protein